MFFTLLNVDISASEWNLTLARAPNVSNLLMWNWRLFKLQWHGKLEKLKRVEKWKEKGKKLNFEILSSLYQKVFKLPLDELEQIYLRHFTTRAQLIKFTHPHWVLFSLCPPVAFSWIQMDQNSTWHCPQEGFSRLSDNWQWPTELIYACKNEFLSWQPHPTV